MHNIARAAHPDDAAACKALLTATAELSRTLPTKTAAEKASVLQALLDRVIVRNDAVEVQISSARLVGLATSTGTPVSNDHQRQCPQIDNDLPPLTRIIPARLARTGMQVRLLIQARVAVAREPDRSLVRLLARAHQFRHALMTSDGRKTMSELAEAAGIGPTYFARVIRLAFLSPSITAAILAGRHPVTLTANKLQHLQQLPNAWTKQLAAIASA